MAAAIYFFLILILWYGIKETRKNKPNWHRPIVSAMMWPLTIFYKKR
jgi:hypothetical protein